MTIIPARSDIELEKIRTLFLEYAKAMEYDRCFETFDQELDTLPGLYREPEGCLLLAKSGGKPTGCIGMKKVDDRTCEMARLWVKPEFRGRGIGREMISNLFNRAIASGYRIMRLETIPERMELAVVLYKSLGFSEVEDDNRCNRACEGIFILEKRLSVISKSD